MSDYMIKPLSPETWDAFVALAEKHNGVWGGCWCTWFHPESAEKGQGADGNRAYKERLVREGRAHAALVFDGQSAVAWCEYGSPEELPGIYHRKQYDAGVQELPRFRITCFFGGQGHSSKRRGTGRVERCARPHRGGGRRTRRGIPAGHAREEDVGVVPLQRHAHSLRERRLRVRACDRQEPLRDAQARDQAQAAIAQEAVNENVGCESHAS
jgi:hypothetical protein